MSEVTKTAEAKRFLKVNHVPDVDQIYITTEASPPKAARAVVDWAEDQAKEYSNQQTFTYRPWDGAAAFSRALMRMFGTEGSGLQTGGGFFSPSNPPKLISVDEQVLVYSDKSGARFIGTALLDSNGEPFVDLLTEKALMDKYKMPINTLVTYATKNGVEVPSPYSESDRGVIVAQLIKSFKVIGTYVGQLQVPWGAVEIPELGVAELSSVMDEDYGMIFAISVTAPKSKTMLAKELFSTIDEELKGRSIYKGRSIDSAGEKPRFYDPFVIDRENIIYTEKLEHQVEKLLLNPIKNTEKARSMRLLKRQHLLTGDYGTGKSLTMLYGAQVALQNGWTVIRYNPSKDNLDSVFKLARMYQPALVLAEDADAFSDVSNPQSVSELLDSFDGMLAKGGEITTIMTTNHPSSITKGMLRPGRIDSLIMFTPLDRQGVERLFKMKIKHLDPATNFDNVYEACEGYGPAFIAEVAERVNAYSLSDVKDEIVTEEQVVFAAQSIRDQHQLHLDADESSRVKPTVDSLIRQTVECTMEDFVIENSQIGESNLKLKVS